MCGYYMNCKKSNINICFMIFLNIHAILLHNINNRLRKNWRILESLNPNQKTKTTRDKLISKGFDFNYFTSIYTTKSGTIYYFIYDQGYLPLENQYYALVKRE